MRRCDCAWIFWPIGHTRFPDDLHRIHGYPEHLCSGLLNEPCVIIVPCSRYRTNSNSSRERWHRCVSTAKLHTTTVGEMLVVEPVATARPLNTAGSQR